MSTFNDWFLTFLEEKAIDLSEFVRIAGKGHAPLGAVCSVITGCTSSEQAGIRKMLVELDFRNGDCVDYLKFLALRVTPSAIERATKWE